MEARYTLMSIVAGGVLLGAVASQAVPSSPLAVQEPGWRGMIQDQYRLAYSPVARGGGPEDATGASLAMVSYDPNAIPDSYTLPPAYAEADRLARAEARAAAEAERDYRLAYAEATRPLDRVTVTRGSQPEEQAAETLQDAEDQAASADLSDTGEGAKILTMGAAQTTDS
ncbi:hypothetical protein B0I00_1340 [Novosphingobium kunmingense]|uniref:Uncharacterized protein n=1 Tax=Novosphingobium kunmingense TaxID=1211806 RepID=A0A2N0HJJ6_9SPHN|nr:hypothetical protein [Novosphingobium kunmingense]PKB19112.1 hypothetical protein B0I00_1340 [Novosphingobium kunmingense]